jgi:hypothetical protein
MKTNCKHENFYIKAKVSRLIDSEESDLVTGYRADITIRCTECQQQFEFTGLPGGYDVNGPTINVDGTELRIPIKPSEHCEQHDNKLQSQQLN